MRYSLEFKLKCVELYRKGIWMETPSGISNHDFKHQVRVWHFKELKHGIDGLKPKHRYKKWTADEKLAVVMDYLTNRSKTEICTKYNINSGMLYTWVRKYKNEGYNGLVDKPKGRKPKDLYMSKIKSDIIPRKLTESEYEELVRLRAENEYIKAENAVIKKEIALREERQAALLKAKKQRLSRNSEKKDTD